MAQRLRDLTELDHVQATLASLYFRDKALRLPEPLRELDLSEASRPSHRSDEGDELLMPLRENR